MNEYKYVSIAPETHGTQGNILTYSYLEQKKMSKWSRNNSRRVGTKCKRQISSNGSQVS